MSLKLHVIPLLGAGLIRLIGSTLRMHQEDYEPVARVREHEPVIFATWHDRTFPLCWQHHGEGVAMLTSEHTDGEMIGRALRYLGYGHLRGSSRRGGARALVSMINTIKAGTDVGITVDGPTGPRWVAKSGVIEVARRTGAAIIPLSGTASRYKSFSSWDQFQLPSLFSKVTVRYGPPLRVPADGDVPAHLARLQSSLDQITKECDKRG